MEKANSKYLLKGDEFVIENYNQAKPFASFLPGIAGIHGKPLWAFYVNRGQCMASFGTDSKKGAIMEFYSANTTYRRVTLEGFRTFIKFKGPQGGEDIYEPFHLYGSGERGKPLQRLWISPHEFRIEEISKERSLKIEVIYFTIPEEGFPGLARILRIENLSKQKRELEIIDGMPKICPFGMSEFFMKHMSRTIEAWMEVEGLKEKTPFYKLRVDAADVPETMYIQSGNFYLSLLAERTTRPDIITDPELVFGDFSDLTYPGRFARSNFKISNPQTDRNITPSAFSHCKISLRREEAISILSLMGHADSFHQLKEIDAKINKRFFDDKRRANKELIDRISSSVSVYSGMQKFDLYARQTNLDNILRGGSPIAIGGGNRIVYVFNRKHGDLERDYNKFTLEPEFYSQGDGNYRDTNQNRRNSVWVNPKLAKKDIKDFCNLIQLDGYNPLVIKGDIFSVRDGKVRRGLVEKYFKKKIWQEADSLLAGRFMLGQLMKFISSINLKKDGEKCFNDVIENSISSVRAEHGTGFWIDHWTYNIDLVESYLALFPEKAEELFFIDRDFMFFDDPYRVKPRKGRYISDGEGKVRQHSSVYFDKEKAGLINSRNIDPQWMRIGHGRGAIYKCTLLCKMLSLVVNKIATLDPFGVGVEMESDKPGWCDSLNGLPGLMGSSLSETFELMRLIRFLKKIFVDSGKASITIPIELASFLSGVAEELDINLSHKDKRANYRYWAKSNGLKETYRDKVRFGIDGKERTVKKEELLRLLSLSLEKLEDGITRGGSKNGVPYSYFINEAKARTRGLMPRFISKRLPLFLEGPVHALKVEKEISKARLLYNSVKRSGLYDRRLKMYKLNESLESEPLEIGRMRVFTPGWLENESVWLHMEYKFMLEVLRAGLYEEFFEDFRNALIPFQGPERYGRSVLENSSFIVSSKFFDPSLHGTGFVSRLSGATAEFLHMLLIMNLGNKPFSIVKGELVFRPSPILHKMFFTDEEKTIRFEFKNGVRTMTIPPHSYGFSIFSHTLIIYNNPKKKNTFGEWGVKPIQYEVSYADGKAHTVKMDHLGEPISIDLREGAIERISILLG